MAHLKLRGKTFYARIYTGGGRSKDVCLHTQSKRIAEEKLRQIESSLFRGNGLGLPTKTPIGDVLDAYVEYIRAHHTSKSAQTEIYRLREAFGVVCETALNLGLVRAVSCPNNRGEAHTIHVMLEIGQNERGSRCTSRMSIDPFG